MTIITIISEKIRISENVIFAAKIPCNWLIKLRIVDINKKNSCVKPRTAQWRGAAVKSFYPGLLTFMVTSCRADAGNECEKTVGSYNTFKFNFKLLQRSRYKR